jgi:hypothetical protein
MLLRQSVFKLRWGDTSDVSGIVHPTKRAVAAPWVTFPERNYVQITKPERNCTQSVLPDVIQGGTITDVTYILREVCIPKFMGYIPGPL